MQQIVVERSVREIQTALVARGFDVGKWGIDGDYGPDTEAAIVAFKKAMGLVARPYYGPVTDSVLFDTDEPAAVILPEDPPWLMEIRKHMGMHEQRDNAALRQWLASDGATLGDPAAFPWCGDAVQTAIRLALPEEPFIGRVKSNPYLARNWEDFGEEVPPCYGSVGVFWRGNRSGISGHVAFLMGVNEEGSLFRVRGGNQANRVSDTWIGSHRLLSARWPISYRGERRPLPVMNSDGAIISRNEA